MLRTLGFAFLFAISPTVLSAFDLRISLSAEDDGLAGELSDVVLTAALAKQDENASAQDILAAAQADYVRIVGLMYDRGFFAPVISIRIDGREAADISPLRPPRTITTVDMLVETGAVFRFGRMALGPVAAGTELPGKFDQGQPASTTTLRDAVEAGVTGWRNRGHAKATLSSQQITADHATNQISADIRLSPGPQLRFGNLRIRGNEAMRPDRIRDIAGLPTEQIFDPEELDRAAERLRRTGVFSVVSLTEAEHIKAVDILDIDAQFVEAKQKRIGFGAELSTTDGLTLSSFWLHRNLLGGGERLRLGAEISGIGGETGGEDYEISLNFGRPATFNEDTDFYATAEIESLNEPSYSSKSIALEAGIRRYASDEREYTFGIGLEAGDTTDAFGAQSYRILTFPATAEFDYRDNELDATKGYYLNASVTPFLNLSGTANGVRSYIDARAYHSVRPDERITFALRGQLGSVAGPALADAPADFLFYSGGGGTVRGQNYQSLGVALSNGNTIGGRSFLGLSGEVRVKTGDKLGLVGFLDVGYIGSENFPDGSSGVWHSGAGLGLRYETGIGPVRLDVAVPVSGPGTQSGFEIYIGLGQAF